MTTASSPGREKSTLEPAADRKLRWTVRLGLIVLRLLAVTWRTRVVDGQHLAELRDRGRPLIFVFWHGQMLPLLWHHRNQGVAILISQHKDGELIARIGAALGYRAVRGSTSRGGERALLGLVRELRDGHDVAVTPDGPRGPARRFAPGAAIAAHRAGAPLLPIAAWASRAWRLRSWDQFLIPKPFARVTVAYGPPTEVRARSARAAATDVERLEQIIDHAGALARG